MKIDGIRACAEAWRLQGIWLTNQGIAPYKDRAHLLKMVDALAEGAGIDCCPFASFGDQGGKCNPCEQSSEDNSKACWVEWADKQAGE